MTLTSWYLILGLVLFIAGVVRVLFTQDFVKRLIALNVTGAGSLMVLAALATRSDPVDAVLSALVITGLVITAAFTALAAVLIRRIEATSESHDSEAS